MSFAVNVYGSGSAHKHRLRDTGLILLDMNKCKGSDTSSLWHHTEGRFSSGCGTLGPRGLHALHWASAAFTWVPAKRAAALRTGGSARRDAFCWNLIPLQQLSGRSAAMGGGEGRWSRAAVYIQSSFSFTHRARTAEAPHALEVEQGSLTCTASAGPTVTTFVEGWYLGADALTV